jgi:hypothetical protein
MPMGIVHGLIKQQRNYSDNHQDKTRRKPFSLR